MGISYTQAQKAKTCKGVVVGREKFQDQTAGDLNKAPVFLDIFPKN